MSNVVFVKLMLVHILALLTTMGILYLMFWLLAWLIKGVDISISSPRLQQSTGGGIHDRPWKSQFDELQSLKDENAHLRAVNERLQLKIEYAIQWVSKLGPVQPLIDNLNELGKVGFGNVPKDGSNI